MRTIPLSSRRRLMAGLGAMTLLVGCATPSDLAEKGGAASTTEPEPTDGGEGTADAGGEGGSEGGAEGENESGGGTDGETEDSGAEDSGEPPPPPPERVVRFVALGDGGEGNETQFRVAETMAALCASKTDDHPGCAFALYLGDNIYDTGVTSVDDPQFETKFEAPYSVLDFPFYIALGNHDYGVTSLEFWKPDPQVEYTDYSDKWTLPDRYYNFSQEHVLFLGLDTNAIMLEGLWGDSGQGTWIDATIAANPSAAWRVAFGHHPYLSNGEHGNAGEYEGTGWLPIVNGETVRDFVNNHLCGQVDIYLCGHDHNRQWLDTTCGTEFVVSGAASKLTGMVGRGSPTLFEADDKAGFLWVEIREDRFVGEFYNIDGTLEYSREWTKVLPAG